jgi:putative membrane protein
MPLRESFAPIATSKTLSNVFIAALAVGGYSVLAVLKENSRYSGFADTPSQFHAVLSLVLGWMLVFRTNTAYSRWWEARTLWGALVNASRNLAVKLNNYGHLESDQLEQARQLIVAFPLALRAHLRDEVKTKFPQQIHSLCSSWEHKPLGVANNLFQLVGNWRKAALISGDDQRVIDAELLRLMDICGGCERIQRTPIVRSYRLFARQCVILFLATLPWGIVEDFGWWTILLTIIMSYFMIGLEIVAEHVEEPFGYDDDDLDLDGLCVTIERSTNEVFLTHTSPEFEI